MLYTSVEFKRVRCEVVAREMQRYWRIKQQNGRFLLKTTYLVSFCTLEHVNRGYAQMVEDMSSERERKKKKTNNFIFARRCFVLSKHKLFSWKKVVSSFFLTTDRLLHILEFVEG